MKSIWLISIIFSTLVAAGSFEAAAAEHSRFKIRSPDFADQGSIPSKFTCEGGDTSPALSWTSVPAGTKSLALIVDDPDAPDPKAPKMTWVHWVVYNIPPTVKSLKEGAGSSLPAGAVGGLNGWKKTVYGGPCPPIGRHRYFFKLYALDDVLPPLQDPSKKGLESAMKGHMISETQMIGTYEKKK